MLRRETLLAAHNKLKQSLTMRCSNVQKSAVCLPRRKRLNLELEYSEPSHGAIAGWAHGNEQDFTATDVCSSIPPRTSLSLENPNPWLHTKPSLGTPLDYIRNASHGRADLKKIRPLCDAPPCRFPSIDPPPNHNGRTRKRMPPASAPTRACLGLRTLTPRKPHKMQKTRGTPHGHQPTLSPYTDSNTTTRPVTAPANKRRNACSQSSTRHTSKRDGRANGNTRRCFDVNRGR